MSRSRSHVTLFQRTDLARPGPLAASKTADLHSSVDPRRSIDANRARVIARATKLLKRERERKRQTGLAIRDDEARRTHEWTSERLNLDCGDARMQG